MRALKNHVVVLLIALPLAMSLVTDTAHALPEFAKWHVYIVNGLSNNDTLFVHCKSTDNDLGIHNLSSGSNFTWGFRQNLFRRTLFWCYLGKDNTHAAFKAYWQDVLLFYKCLWKCCIWTAKEDGIYLKNLRKNVDEFRHKWEQGWIN